MEKRVTAPLTLEQVKDLKCGDSVLISGVIYTARDAAHKRLCELVEQGKELPFDPKDSVIYYVGPAPAKGNQVIGSAGPTTSYRMDAYSPTMIKLGQRGMIGKGKRSPEVIAAMKEHGAVYFGAIGGAGALLSMLPGASGIDASQIDEKAFDRIEAMIYSMTKEEREKPSIINPKRKRRIAAGSGTRVEDVNKLLKQYEMMQKMMKQFKKSPKGFARRLGGMMGNPNAFRGLK